MKSGRICAIGIDLGTTNSAAAEIVWEEGSGPLPALSRRSIQGLLKNLRSEGKIRLEGKTRAAKWYPTPAIE